MTVACNDADLNRKFTADDLLNVNHSVIRAIAKTLVKLEAEHLIAMNIEYQNDRPVTYESLIKELQDIKNIVRDQIRAIFENIETEILREAENILPVITEMKFNFNGCVESATVTVTCPQNITTA
jgi:transcription initiation factor IIE alpha subunit